MKPFRVSDAWLDRELERYEEQTTWTDDARNTYLALIELQGRRAAERQRDAT